MVEETEFEILLLGNREKMLKIPKIRRRMDEKTRTDEEMRMNDEMKRLHQEILLKMKRLRFSLDWREIQLFLSFWRMPEKKI